VLYAGPLQAAFGRFLRARLPAAWAARLAAPAGEYVLVTVAAQITTLPLMVLYFGRLAGWGLLTNILVLPPQPLIMMLSGAAAIAGLVWLPLGRVLGWLFWPLPAYSNAAVELLARLPGGNVDVSAVAPGLLALVYALLFAATWAQRAGRLGRLWKPTAVITAAGLAAAVVSSAALSAPDGRLHITILPAADAVLVTTPGGRHVLIGGADAETLAGQVPPRLPAFSRQLEGMILPAVESRGLADLPGLFERLPAAWLAAPDALWASPAGEKLEKGLLDTDMRTGSLPAGMVFDLGDGARLEVLAESDEGAALLLTWGNFRALLPGDVPPERLKGRGLEGCTLLVLPSQEVVDWEWLQPLMTWSAAQENALRIVTDRQEMRLYRLP